MPHYTNATPLGSGPNERLETAAIVRRIHSWSLLASRLSPGSLATWAAPTVHHPARFWLRISSIRFGFSAEGLELRRIPREEGLA